MRCEGSLKNEARTPRDREDIVQGAEKDNEEEANDDGKGGTLGDDRARLPLVLCWSTLSCWVPLAWCAGGFVAEEDVEG